MRAFLLAETTDETARDDVAHDDFKLNHVEPLDEHFAFADLFEEVRLNAAVFELLEKEFADFVVDDAFAVDDAVFLAVERGGVVLEVNQQLAGVVGLEDGFRFALVQKIALNHDKTSLKLQSANVSKSSGT